MKQFDRELVKTMHFDAENKRLLVEVEEHGLPAKTVAIALPF